MARPHRDDIVESAAHLTKAFWLSETGVADPSPRERFLFLTIYEFGRLGPGQFSHTKIARDLGYTTAMINHYFGSRNGLIAEAAATVYLRYIEEMRSSVAQSPRNPIARLRTWITTQIDFAFRYPGWAVINNYPRLTLDTPVEYEERFQREMTAGFELNLGRLAQLILDVWSNTVTSDEVDESHFDRQGYLAKPRLVELTASVAMSTLGAAVWGAGRHEPSSRTDEARALSEHVISRHVDNIVEYVQSQNPDARA